jgi:hypothetical protein
MPKDKAALAKVPGVGPTKLERYADEVLDVLQSHSPDSAGSPQPSA